MTCPLNQSTARGQRAPDGTDDPVHVEVVDVVLVLEQRVQHRDAEPVPLLLGLLVGEPEVVADDDRRRAAASVPMPASPKLMAGGVKSAGGRENRALDGLVWITR